MVNPQGVYYIAEVVKIWEIKMWAWKPKKEDKFKILEAETTNPCEGKVNRSHNSEWSFGVMATYSWVSSAYKQNFMPKNVNAITENLHEHWGILYLTIWRLIATLFFIFLGRTEIIKVLTLIWYSIPS